MRILLAGVVLLAGCSGGQPAPVTVPLPDTPTVAVEQWLGAVVALDVETLVAVVEPVGLAVLAGVENGVRSDELVTLLEEGLEGDLARTYWQAFRDDFAAIRGVPLSALTVEGETQIEGVPGYSAAGVASADGAGHVIVRGSDTTGWQMDMAATAGPALAGQLGEYLSSALAGDHAVVISDAYRAAVLPALDAAIALDPQNADLVFATEFIRQLLAQ